MSLDDLDRRLLTIIQSSFPIAAEPYKQLAEELNTTEEDILSRVQRFKDTGLIRRIGGIFDSRNLGYKSTLCAMRAPEDKLEKAIAVVNEYPGVTHNYLREHEFNVWFTLITPSEEYMEKVLDEIRERTGCEVHNLPAVRFFKIKVDFRLDKERQGAAEAAQ
ncbi:AsnC family transcriptional regulator [Heliobacillus mobilis]|uniref:siroheme decarboxylase n=1 Tax=Heliobacterium mobile TaxID=28064 RepID=A7UFD5_HELMO|nr:AsnC family transcriptional regulator [Heliobacterium mobile]ABT18047.1 heme d1 biosynthesis protein [Heliobacterium mobile]MTV47482.1 AsnC family transcriptional regulator [Heliobacterium mobile]